MKKQEIVSIPIAQINIANPRTRNRQKWNEIVTSIRSVGLKRPITVSMRPAPDPDGKEYDLVCGQGRIEALLALGESMIPAIVIDATREDRFLMSLVENIARRPPSNREILHEVTTLRARGYNGERIAEKIGFDRGYISGIIHLIEKGEDALIGHVEGGRIPLNVAIEIAGGNDQAVSHALSEAYEQGMIRGPKLKQIRRIVADHVAKQKAHGKNTRTLKKMTGEHLVQIYQQRVREHAQLVGRSAKVREKLALISSAMRKLLSDENFTTLLRAENLLDMPDALASRVS